VAVDGGDDRAADGQQVLGEVGPFLHDLQRDRRVLEGLDHLHVAAGAEHLPGAGDHHRADVVDRHPQRPHDPAQLPVHLERGGVAPLGPVERDDEDAVVVGAVDEQRVEGTELGHWAAASSSG
jgi:hypothetical protein